MMQLAVILLNYRTPDLVADCLRSLEPEIAAHADRCVVVVDNDSADGSAEAICASIEAAGYGRWARVHETGHNGGFSFGLNRGMEAAPAENYLLLNSDTLVREGALDRLLRAADAAPTAGILAPRLEWPDETPQQSCFRFATPTSEFLAAAGTGPVTRLFSHAVVALPVSDEPLEPEWSSFACVLVRHAMVKAIGGLDEGYFMYFEDMDCCRRARAAGWSVRYEPSARVVHLRGGSSPVKQAFATNTRVPRYWFAARNRYFARSFGGRLGVLRANAAWLAGRSISKLRESIGRKRPHLADGQARDLWTDWQIAGAPAAGAFPVPAGREASS